MYLLYIARKWDKPMGPFALWSLRHFETMTKYDPLVVESDVSLAQLWQPSARPYTQRPRFTMLMPPPNVTGNLHLGHAYTLAIQDMLARWRRMSGDEVQWIPGLDHAGIATQVVVERHLMNTLKLSRHQLGREAFVEHVWKWKESNGSSIITQMNSMGITCDWSKLFFTMDEFHSRAVQEAFGRLYKKGLIYRAERMVNWCCHLQSTVSDIEVDWRTINQPTKLTLPGRRYPVEFGNLDVFTYPLEHSSTEGISVATTRLETMLGDTAIAVHPLDERYSHLISRRVRHPLRENCFLPIVGDETVKPEFGTGAVKLTPAHSEVDFQMAKRHGLDKRNILDPSGCLVNVPPTYQGLDRYEARKKIRDDLTNLGLFVEQRPNDKPMQLPLCSRTEDVLEPVLREQWFINCQSMGQAAVQAAREGRLTFSPASQLAVWEDWLTSCQDWCISRQLWWGHRIPAFYRLDQGQRVWCVESTADGVARLLADGWKQDEDVLDTWFSSGLLPLSTLGWPDKSYSQNYPTSMLETGHDILFFWVARMVMLGLELTGDVPFREVILHGMICDAQGKKMSKSRGNVVDPLKIIRGTGGLSEVHVGTQALTLGADALRMCLTSYQRTGHIVRFHMEDVKECRTFLNKIWQSCRFIAMKCEDSERQRYSWKERMELIMQQHKELRLSDWWMLSRLVACVRQVNNGLETRALNEAPLSCRQTWWSNMCDVYLELVKARGSSQLGNHILLLVVEVLIHLLHPTMPFITECLWRDFLKRQGSLLDRPFPQAAQFEPLLELNRSHADLQPIMAEALRYVGAINDWVLILRVPNKSLASSACLVGDVGADGSVPFHDLLVELMPVLSKVQYHTDPEAAAAILAATPQTLQIPLFKSNGLVLHIDSSVCNLEVALKTLSKKQLAMKSKQEELVHLEAKKMECSTDVSISEKFLKERIEETHEMLHEIENKLQIVRRHLHSLQRSSSTAA